ncbi:hypothetical protein [Acidithrix ferrooxidans]|uniref:hypothetical protein n=1 Tax=Acidithrix ferrooxidans TaxID=1280514 RepID=UPI001269D868|nr:hypothetical protein [Acidithrix ferrooxidans]
MTNPKLALWTYNAGWNGVSYKNVNGKPTVVYNDSIFAHSSDNPARYVLDVLSNAARYSSGTISGSSSMSVTGLAPGASGSVNQLRQRSALWMALLSGNSCQSALHTSCFDALPTIMGNYDGIVIPSAPSQMKQDLISTSKPLAGDIILFGSYVTTTNPKIHKQTTRLQINNNSYGVMLDPTTNKIALVVAGTAPSFRSAINVVQMPSAPSVGGQIDSQTVQFIGSPFG